CGTGATTLALAKAAGPRGRVTGVDVSAPMLALARQRAEKSGLPVTFVEGDASILPFKPEYDLIFSRFGVMFFDDPPAAFANLRKALKRGGRLAFVCWRTSAENPWASAPLAAAKPFLPDQPPPDPLAPGPFAFADPERVKDILGKAGFRDAEIRRYDGAMPMGRDVNGVAAQTLRIGPLSRAIGEADEAAKARITDAVRGVLERFRDKAGEIAPPTACWLVGARG
ncbi:MAG TPA: class I SAM-dependent methyltransferase, partial [Rhizomicrobium sp.]|nr:class I SAM-dependent methyltransferase [Rhizomicrobium sp.]